ncbi:NADH pyrophosphatase [Streptomyces violaceorubidus]
MTTWTDHTADRPISLTAPSGIDRAAHHRLDEAWLAAAWSHPSTRCFVVSGGQVLIDETPDGATELVMTPSFEAPLTEAHRYFLGTDEDGTSYFALQKDSLPGRMDQSARPAGLREAGLLLSPRDAGLMAHAVALENWQRLHRFCSRCGERTVIAAAGHIRRCPACGAEHYPRTDPAVIMAVTDEEDRILLGRQVHWPEGRFSTLAGFVEPGESIEQSVRREVQEEVGVTVGPASPTSRAQPWPFPYQPEAGLHRPAGPMPRHTEIRRRPDETSAARRFSREPQLGAAFDSGDAVLFRPPASDHGPPHRAVVPQPLRDAQRLLDRPDVHKAGSALRAAARFGGNDSLLDDVVDLPSQVRAVLSGEGWTTQPPAGSGAVRERWESLAALVGLAQDFAAARAGATLSDLVVELDERAGAQHAPTVQGVTLASLHSAKGLEWDVVFLVGVAEGMMPITYAKTDEQIEEERRLLYVGVTRARERLHLSWALARSPGGRPSRRPSRFLKGLRPGSGTAGWRAAAGGAGGVERGVRGGRGGAEAAAPRRTQRTPARCRVCGRTLTDAGEMKLMRCEGCPSDMDEGVYERLREWRAVQAGRSGQPAFCVFTDKTLMAIAESVPEDERELARIPGVGARKLNRYGADVLAICAGQEGVGLDEGD